MGVVATKNAANHGRGSFFNFVARQNYFEFCHESPRTQSVEMNSTGMKMDEALGWCTTIPWLSSLTRTFEQIYIIKPSKVTSNASTLQKSISQTQLLPPLKRDIPEWLPVKGNVLPIIDMGQCQAVCRGTLEFFPLAIATFHLPGSFRDGAFNVGNCQLPTTHRHQCTHQEADHFVQESVTLDDNVVVLKRWMDSWKVVIVMNVGKVLNLKLQIIQSTNCSLGILLLFRSLALVFRTPRSSLKGRKIVCSPQQFAGLLYRF